jgi:AraC-like DNA-binding protein
VRRAIPDVVHVLNLPTGSKNMHGDSRQPVRPGPLDLAGGLTFEPFVIDHLVDARGRYRLDLDPEFPFAIKLYHFVATSDAYPLNWHERLEIFVPLSGEGDFRMGDRVIAFRPGDLLVVDNLKLHGLASYRGADRRAMTITFDPELVYTIGSPLSDFAYLVPFHCQTDLVEPLVSSEEALCGPVHGALARLVRCYFDEAGSPYARLGCKAYLLELLFLISRHFAGAEVAHSEYVRQQERAKRLGRLFDHLQEHYAKPLTIPQAARMVGMSESRFMKFFKQSTGTTLVSYVTHVRLAHACELLRRTDLPVAEIAVRVGLPDHTYFDRRFRQQFRTSPRAMRAQWSQREGSAAIPRPLSASGSLQGRRLA